MLNASLLSLAESSAFFGHSSSHIPVHLHRLPNARVVWVNQRAMKADPAFEACGGTCEEYANHLLRTCAYAIADDGSQGEAITGFADRYGGVGIGRNGGSGRAAMVHGYHIKGIGRTPLVSTLADQAHASGGAYLEECVREAIFSELVAAEFPGDSVPIFAIIDTGLVQAWQTDHGLIHERRCLMVRPGVLRPAHFERAPAYMSGYLKEGHRDALRVCGAFGKALDLWGGDALLGSYRRFWQVWAEQLAYAYVHRLPHGGDNTSNIALDGRLLDFGGMTAVPSWARISTIMGCPPSGENFVPVVRAIQTHVAFWERYAETAATQTGAASDLIVLAAQSYQHTVVREVLRVAGLSYQQAEQLLSSADQTELTRIIGRVLTHFRREHLAVFNGMPMPAPHFTWDIGQLWSDVPPVHLQALRQFLAERLGLDTLDESGSAQRQMITQRCALRSRNREALYRDVIKRDLYRALETDLQGEALCQESLDHLISERVCQGRRDSPVEPDDAMPIGFARNATAGYALFEELATKRLFAIREWAAATDNETSHTHSPRIAIERIAKNSIFFADASMPAFHGSLISTA